MKSPLLFGLLMTVGAMNANAGLPALGTPPKLTVQVVVPGAAPTLTISSSGSYNRYLSFPVPLGSQPPSLSAVTTALNTYGIKTAPTASVALSTLVPGQNLIAAISCRTIQGKPICSQASQLTYNYVVNTNIVSNYTGTTTKAGVATNGVLVTASAPGSQVPYAAPAYASVASGPPTFTNTGAFTVSLPENQTNASFGTEVCAGGGALFPVCLPFGAGVVNTGSINLFPSINPLAYYTSATVDSQTSFLSNTAPGVPYLPLGVATVLGGQGFNSPASSASVVSNGTFSNLFALLPGVSSGFSLVYTPTNAKGSWVTAISIPSGPVITQFDAVAPTTSSILFVAPIPGSNDIYFYNGALPMGQLSTVTFPTSLGVLASVGTTATYAVVLTTAGNFYFAPYTSGVLTNSSVWYQAGNNLGNVGLPVSLTISKTTGNLYYSTNSCLLAFLPGSIFANPATASSFTGTPVGFGVAVSTVLSATGALLTNKGQTQVPQDMVAIAGAPGGSCPGAPAGPGNPLNVYWTTSNSTAASYFVPAAVSPYTGSAFALGVAPQNQ